MNPEHETDDDLIERLRRIAAEVDAPPPDVLVAARAALATRRLDEELAELVMDSESAGAGQVRAGADTVRLLSFESPAVSVELQVQVTATGRAVRGLVAGAVGEVVLEGPGQQLTAELDEDGWFALPAAPAGTVRLRLRTPDGTAVTSSWMSL
ncbi:hypothetical protein [Pseudonocardia sp. GCM10023141]|uniref:hypothetical protein n=1 Tax=Pseudonocardia sp. GCM10023141 TaxID=3252653 RepID=UPI00361FE2A2